MFYLVAAAAAWVLILMPPFISICSKDRRLKAGVCRLLFKMTVSLIPMRGPLLFKSVSDLLPQPPSTRSYISVAFRLLTIKRMQPKDVEGPSLALRLFFSG